MTVRLVVRAPLGRIAERRYVLDLVLTEWLGQSYRLEPGPDARMSITLESDELGRELRLPDILLGTPDDAWLKPESVPAPGLAHVRPAAPGSGSVTLPVLFGAPTPAGVWSTRSADAVDVHVDVIGSAFFLLTRYEELVNDARDDHGRVPAATSIASREGFLDRPILDEYVDLLWDSMASLWPELERPPRAFRLDLSHDVDQPWASVGLSPLALAHALAGDALRRRDLRLLARRARATVDARTGRLDRDPYATFDFLMRVSEDHGIRSTFYLLAGNQPGEPDFRYRIDDPPVLDLLRSIHDRGHDIGLHASYGSYRSSERMTLELAALRDACRRAGFDQRSWGVRQHYLRFEAPTTWRAHVAAGLAHDASIGYADAVGFRAGTCRDFPVFDAPAGRQLELRERPLIVMDATLLGYNALDLAGAEQRASHVLAAAQRVGGVGTVLYHNSSLATPALRRHYAALVDRFASRASGTPALR